MEKYNVPRQDQICEVCGEPLYLIDGQLICLDCDMTEAREPRPKVKKPRKKETGAN